MVVSLIKYLKININAEECKGVIYCAYNNINEKVYIGYTNTTLYRRKIAHYYKSKHNDSNNYFHCALNKYKKTDFTWFVLYQNNNTDSLKSKEKYFISFFKSNNRNFGYNLSSGGEQCYFNTEVRKKLSEKAKSRNLGGKNNPFYGKKHSEETRKHWSNIRKGKIPQNGFVKHSEETKKILSDSRKKWSSIESNRQKLSLYNQHRIPIMEIKSGKKFNSLKEASLYLNIRYKNFVKNLKYNPEFKSQFYIQNSNYK